MAEVYVPTFMNATISPAGFPTEGLPNEGYRLWLALVVMIIASGSLVMARVATRISTGQMGSDDYAIVGSMASCLVQTILWALSVRTGYGADYLKLDKWHRDRFNMWWFIGACFYPVTIALFKTSVILLNKRIFVQQSFQTLCWVTLVVNTCWALGNTLGWIFQCTPIPVMWGVISPGTVVKCFNQHGLWISLVTWDVATDVWVMGMAVPMVWRLHLGMREKFMLTFVFLLGAIVVVFSIMSCSAIVSGLQKEAVQSNTYTFGLANLFQVLESNMGIIGACLPVLRVPLKQSLPWLFGSTKVSRDPAGYYTDDRFTDQYVLQKIPSKQKDSSHATWRDVSVSGPEIFRSARRKSDEMGIIGETVETTGDRDSGNDLDGGSSRSQLHNAIRKHTVVSVDRV